MTQRATLARHQQLASSGSTPSSLTCRRHRSSSPRLTKSMRRPWTTTSTRRPRTTTSTRRQPRAWDAVGRLPPGSTRCLLVGSGNQQKQDEKYKDVKLNAIEFFKECHNSNKTGLSEAVKKALVQMEAIVDEPAQEGQSTEDSCKAVAQVLPSRTFLRNVGLETIVPKRSSNVRVHELEAQVEAEKQVAAELRDKFEALNKKVMEIETAREKQLEEMEQARKKEEARQKQQEEMEELRKQCEATNAVLHHVFGFDKG